MIGLRPSAKNTLRYDTKAKQITTIAISKMAIASVRIARLRCLHSNGDRWAPQNPFQRQLQHLTPGLRSVDFHQLSKRVRLRHWFPLLAKAFDVEFDSFLD